MKWRPLILWLHRDLGYFFAGVTILYAVSGLAVNHVDDWNPSYSVEQREVTLDLPDNSAEVTEELVKGSLAKLGEVEHYRNFDVISSQRMKIYLTDGSMVVDLAKGTADYEIITSRPLLQQFNRLHLNPTTWWRWFSDAFAVGLVLVAITGLFVARGRHGLAGRGKWLVGAGLIAPLLAIFLT